MKKKRLVTLIVLGTMLFIGYFSFIALTSQQSKRTNIIIISVDTLNPFHMGIYGNKRNTTPYIDAFAKDSVVFTRAYTNMPMTVNSFYTLFRGSDDVFKKESLSIKNVNLRTIDPNTPTLTKLLKENKYSTAAFITNPALGMVSNEFFSRNFDEFSFLNTISQRKEDYPKIFAYEYNHGKLVNERAKEWLRKNKNKKFFLWLHYDVAHQPYNPPSKFLCQIDKDCAISKYQDLLTNPRFAMTQKLPFCGESVEDEVKKKAETLYDAEVLANDELVGEMLNQLKKLGLYEKSVIVFYGDHGEGFDHNIFGHGKALYESSIRIPLIIRDPKSTLKTKVSKLVDNSDIAPTLFDLLGITFKKESFNGISFAPALSSKDYKKRDYVYSVISNRDALFGSQNEGTRYAVISDFHKYILSDNFDCFYKNEAEELYDFKKDPQEEDNLITKEPHIVGQLKDKLLGKVKERAFDAKDVSADEELIERFKSLGY